MIWAATFFAGLVMTTLITVLGLFLILLVLIQRGKGGGLTGALGGMGGSSAFGSRAGDAFTRITIVTAAIWIFLIMIEIRLVQPPRVVAPQSNIILPAPGAGGENQPEGGNQ
jgi:preprotein translocase subunit SecG